MDVRGGEKEMADHRLQTAKGFVGHSFATSYCVQRMLVHVALLKRFSSFSQLRFSVQLEDESGSEMS